MTWRHLPLTKFAAAIAALLFLSGCRDNPEAREWQFWPDMYNTAVVKAQREDDLFPDHSGSRLPPAGTVPRDWQPIHIAWNQPELSEQLVNPLPRTKEVMETGRRYFNTFCIACHNWSGNGVTPVTQPGRMALPPPLWGEKVVKWPDGHIFHNITHGQGNMPSYADRLSPEKRWAIVHYVRALQLAALPPEDVVKEFETAGKPGTEHDNPLAVRPSAPTFPEK